MVPLLPALLALGPASLAGSGVGRWRRCLPALRRGDEASVARSCGPDAGGSFGSDVPSGVVPTFALVAVLLVVASTITGCFSKQADYEFEACEGYWAPPETCLPLGLTRPSGAPNPQDPNKDCPQWRMDPNWGGRDQFLQRLSSIEASAQDANDLLGSMTQAELEQRGLGNIPWVNVMSFRGASPSRIESNKFVGNKEFVELRQLPGMCWPAGYGRYYVGEHNVVPSKKFQLFVQNFDLTAFKSAADQLKQLEQPQQFRSEPASKKARGGLAEIQIESTFALPDDYDLVP